jgi:hypothetical protein
MELTSRALPTLAAPLPSVSCSTRLSRGNPHPARLRLSVHSIPDESQKKACQNKIRGASCVSRCQAGWGTLIPPHKCGSDSAAQTQPRPAPARIPLPSSRWPGLPFQISCHVERKSRQRLEPKLLRLFFGSTDDSHRRVLSRQAPSLPPQHCHPEERSDEGSAVAFSCFRVEHHSIFDCGCRSDLSERNFPIGGDTLAITSRAVILSGAQRSRRICSCLSLLPRRR